VLEYDVLSGSCAQGRGILCLTRVVGSQQHHSEAGGRAVALELLDDRLALVSLFVQDDRPFARLLLYKASDFELPPFGVTMHEEDSRLSR